MAESWVFSSLITASYSTYTQARTLVKMTGSWSQDRYSLSCYNGSVTYIQLVPYCTGARTMMKCEQQAPNANDQGSRKLENTPETREMVVKPIISRRQVNQHQQHQGQTLACMNQATRYSGIQFNPVHSTLLHGRFTFDLYSNVQARLRLVPKLVNKAHNKSVCEYGGVRVYGTTKQTAFVRRKLRVCTLPSSR